MKFEKIFLDKAYLIELEENKDFRGSFTRHFCQKELKQAGLNFELCQSNISKNLKKGTIRGMHYQQDPYSEIKIVSCLKGAIFDVIVDFRPNSSTYLKWFGVELTENNNKMLYIPEGFAHGFETLEDNSVVYYQMGNFYTPSFAGGLRFNDPKLGIKWHTSSPIINERDANYELL